GLRAPALSSAATPAPSSSAPPLRTPGAAAPPPSRPGFDERVLGDASVAAAEFGRSRPPVWGVAVVVPSRGVIYGENADAQVPAHDGDDPREAARGRDPRRSDARARAPPHGQRRAGAALGRHCLDRRQPR